MAGRGRGMTLPAWMTKSQENGSGGLGGGSDHASVGGASMESGQFEDAQRGDNSVRDRGRTESRDRDRDRDRDDRSRRSRDESRGKDRDRSGSRGRRRSRKPSRSRSRSSDRSKDRRRSRKSRSRSRSQSRTPPRRKKRSSNFDVPPQGMTLESAQAADLLTQTVLRQQAEAAALQTPSTTAPAAVSAFAPPPAMTAGGVPAMNPYVAPGVGVAAANMQQTRHARRLYVGGITEVSEFELREFFNEIINKALDQPIEGGAVVSVYINMDRHFAFVELKSIELTTACINNLDGIPFKGNPLKIRRPTDYQPHLVPPTVNPPPKLNLARLGIIGTTVPDGPDKIFIGGIPYHLSDDQVKELLAAFGPLKAFHLVKDSGSITSKGYAFCEYLDPSVGPVACSALNGMQLGGKTLTVRNAMSQTDAKSAQEEARYAQAAAGSVNSALTLGVNNMAGLGAQAALGFQGIMPGMGMGVGMPGMPGMGMMGMPAAAPGQTLTRVLVLLNMVTSDDLVDDNEYEDIVNDVREEVSKYGQVQSLVMPRPPAIGVGKIFVEYTDPSGAQAAANALQGRQFAGRTVQASFHDEGKFAGKDFS